ncbi:hypothetical protein A2482_03310 [Candidatus Falkowbacteria bacterium RIFOXYC2_FULL_48_21]|uniref:AtpZ/AtpI family protein n=1 Tax=Candidatus Falkowbacteria bacterium RIFOXYC2_FULL_48_21 TaxID=1798005 RepID=A0A1F5TD36_9BACT|nr:MAG: hypothetical protein A2482_03310 [Candidatus Falkowbacteria bacterium RIFOXYC2_FULL_48_21]
MADKRDNLKQIWWQPAIQLFAQVSAWIVLPIVVALFVGRWLDERFDKPPTFLISCVMIAFGITCFGLVRETVRAAKKMEEEAKVKSPKGKV